VAIRKSKTKATSAPVPGPELGLGDSVAYKDWLESFTVSWDETGTGTISSKPLSLSYSIKTTPSITYGGSTYGGSTYGSSFSSALGLISESALRDLANALVKERYPDYDPSR
jgi:hypothetical protein